MPVVLDVMFVAVLAALLVPLLTRGSYQRLAKGWRGLSLLIAGFGVQAALGIITIPEARRHTLGFGALVASYVLILGFCGGNLLKRGMGVVLVGIACNALVITLNQGMPVDVPADWAADGGIETTVKHHPQTSQDRLPVLGDVIAVREPSDAVLSFGDLILMLGLMNVTYHASRRPRPRRQRRAMSASGATPAAAPAGVGESGDPVPAPDAEPRRQRAQRDRETEEPAPAMIDLSAYDLPVRRGSRELALAVRRHPANGLHEVTSDAGR